MTAFIFLLILAFGAFLGYITAHTLTYHEIEDVKCESYRYRQSINDLLETIENLKDKVSTLEQAPVIPAHDNPEEYSVINMNLPIRLLPDESEIQKSLKAGCERRAEKVGLSDKATLQDVVNAEEKRRTKNA